MNRTTAQLVPGLFSRNERVFCGFDAGGMPFGVILVGALNVGSMATVWHGDVTPRKHREVTALPVTDLLAPKRAAQGRGNGALQHGLDGDPVVAARRRRLDGTLTRPDAAHGRTHWHAARLASRQRIRRWLKPGTGAPPPRSRHCVCARRRCAPRASFFFARNVLEVETPAMVNTPVSDVNLGSVSVQVPGRDAPLFLHTSPEYAMKRLLAAGSGDIFQICRVYRGAERGRQHNPEFTMLEWYRLGFSLEDLMREVAELARALLGHAIADGVSDLSRCRAPPCGIRSAGRGFGELQRAAQELGLAQITRATAGRDELLDLIVGAKVGPGSRREDADVSASLSGIAGRARAPRRR